MAEVSIRNDPLSTSLEGRPHFAGRDSNRVEGCCAKDICGLVIGDNDGTLVTWPSGEAQVCKTCYGGSSPSVTSMATRTPIPTQRPGRHRKHRRSLNDRLGETEQEKTLDRQPHTNVDIVEEGGMSPVVGRVVEGVITGVTTGLVIKALSDGDAVNRRTPQQMKSSAVSFAQAARLRSQPMFISPRWKWLPLGEPFHVMFWGPPYSGKSTQAVAFANDLSRNHSVVYMMAEERPDAGPLAHRAMVTRSLSKTVEVIPTTDVEEINHYIGTYNPQVCVIDSINTVTDNPRLILTLMSRYPQTSFLLIVQSSHHGKWPRNAGAVEHQCDTTVEIREQGKRALVSKNRFANDPKKQVGKWIKLH